VSSDDSLAAFLVSVAAESRRHPHRWPDKYDPLQLVHGFARLAVRDALRRGELNAESAGAPFVDVVAATAVGLLSTRHPRAGRGWMPFSSSTPPCWAGSLAELPQPPVRDLSNHPDHGPDTGR
jgi:hypothetical protein